MDLDERAARLRALWKSGRDKYSSFYTVLGEVRPEIGDDALPNWCFDNLRIGIDVITETAKVLRGVDAKIAKADLAAAKEAGRRKRHEMSAPARAARVNQLLARIRELEAQAGDARVNQLLARICELEVQLAEAKVSPAKKTKPLRDRADYMREYMRRRRAAQPNGPSAGSTEP
jgi:hypothetical protein